MKYRVRKGLHTGWNVYTPAGRLACTANHHANAVWLAHTFAVRAGVQERMRNHHGR